MYSETVTEEQVLAVADWLRKSGYGYTADCAKQAAADQFKPPEPTTRERLAEKLYAAYESAVNARLRSFSLLPACTQNVYLAEADAALEFVRESIEDEDDVFDGENGSDYEAGAIDHERAILRRLS